VSPSGGCAKCCRSRSRRSGRGEGPAGRAGRGPGSAPRCGSRRTAGTRQVGDRDRTGDFLEGVEWQPPTPLLDPAKHRGALAANGRLHDTRGPAKADRVARRRGCEVPGRPHRPRGSRGGYPARGVRPVLGTGKRRLPPPPPLIRTSSRQWASLNGNRTLGLSRSGHTRPRGTAVKSTPASERGGAGTDLERCALIGPDGKAPVAAEYGEAGLRDRRTSRSAHSVGTSLGSSVP
jgi:hypothetical protein